MSKWSQPTPVSDIEVAFPTEALKLMPSMEEIPKEFKLYPGGYYNKLFSEWFYKGISRDRLPAKDGVDQSTAIRHLLCVIGSFEPQHEHKAAAAAYLMSLWIEPLSVPDEATA